MAQKIGVYFDKSSVGPFFDYDELISYVEGKFGGLCPVVKAHPLLSSNEGQKLIQADIDEGSIDSVLICGATPRVDWEFFKFGNGILVDRVNLREHCVLSYQNPDGTVPEIADEEAPEMLMGIAQDYIAMGVSKLEKAKPPVPEDIEINDAILVLGGGWTGLTSALDAAKTGHAVFLVEKSSELGGYAAKMYKTTPLTYPHTDAQDTGVDAKIAAVEADELITVITSATLTQLKGAPGTYEAALSNGETLKVGAVVLATGWVPQSTDVLAPLGYGSVPAVITSMELEEKVKNGELKDGAKVAFILNTENCVSSDSFLNLEKCDDDAEAAAPPAEGEEEEEKYIHEDLESERHLPYANAVASMVALKQAGYVADKGGVAYVFYDHMMVPGIHERFYKAAQDKLGVMMSKAVIAGVEADAAGAVVKAADTLIGEDLEVRVDFVVVPTGMVPATAKDPIMNFDYRQGPAFPDLDLFDGFADSNYICFPYETRRTGVYAAGAIRQPMLLDAAEDDASGATLKAIQCLESINRGVSVHPRSGDNSYPVFNFTRCTQCKRCTEECPFGALDDDEKGTPLPNPTRCRRCGTCMGACPERVISFDNYNIDQVGSMIKQIKVPDDMDAGGPRVLILACENDAYPALDMAAQRGKSWSPYVRILPVRCLGSVNAIWIADAMSKGMDGVMLLGCKYGDDYQCHFMKGSEICNRRKGNIAETLERLGVEAERVEQYEIAIDEYDKVPALIEEFLDMCLKLGPNPFKGY